MTDLLARFTTNLSQETSSEEHALAALEAAALVSDLPEADLVARHLPEKGLPIGLGFLHARALAAEGRRDEANAALLSLAERLNQAGRLKAMTRVLTELLPESPADAAPLIARARLLGGQAAVEDALLFEAHRRHPRHGMLTWLTALAHTEAGRTVEARRLAAEALPELVADKDYEAAELAMLMLAEADTLDAFAEVSRALELLARQEAWPVFHNAIVLLGDHLAEGPGAVHAWPVIREIWRKHPDRTELRPFAVRVVQAYLAARYPQPQALLQLSEIERPSQPPAIVLERLERGERFPPGYFARHSGWGMGLIRENDAQAIVIDFPAKPLHRMSLATAEQALDVLAPDDFRVLLARDPAELKRLATQEPVALVLKVLQTQKQRRATGDEIRKQLVPHVMTAASWPSWWKSARDALGADPRVNAQQAYANLWSIAEPRSEEERAPVPPWEQDKDAFKNLTLLDTFLAQHPGERAALLAAHRPRVEQLAGGRAPSAEQAVAAGLWLLRLDPGAAVTPEALVRSTFDMNALARRDQEELLERPQTPESLGAALNSRLVNVRRAAREKLRESAAEEAVFRAILARASEAPEAALDILETESAEEIPRGPGWSHAFLAAVLDLIEKPPREAHRKRAQALIDAASPLARVILGAPLTEDEQASVASRLTRWQSSDRYRFPILDFLRAIGQGEVSDRVEGARARAAAKVSGRLGSDADEGYDTALLLTRPTLHRLDAERQRVGLELKTTIPQAIQKAREHGDLRENAEYEAAKAKQAVFAKRFAELEALLHRARLIEDLKREPGVAAPGTQIQLEEVAGTRTWRFWILGEGDQELGDSVVSYLAPVGKILLGRRTGETIELPLDGERVACRVASVDQRLP
jgi:transcription elongation factor GreA